MQICNLREIDLFNPTLDFSANGGGFFRIVPFFPSYYSVFKRSMSSALTRGWIRVRQSGLAQMAWTCLRRNRVNTRHQYKASTQGINTRPGA
jgi:hypothetical protein